MQRGSADGVAGLIRRRVSVGRFDLGQPRTDDEIRDLVAVCAEAPRKPRLPVAGLPRLDRWS